MSKLSFLITTEVKGQKIQPIEVKANFFLSPARCLWNGRKVDLIEKGDQKAIQYDMAYHADERTVGKLLLMVVLFVPGTVIGVILKVYASYKYHDASEDAWIQRCLDQKEAGTICPLSGQQAFGHLVSNYIGALKSTEGSIGNQPILFLSEIERLYLKTSSKWSDRIRGYIRDETNIYGNVRVLENISLLWKLNYINVNDFMRGRTDLYRFLDGTCLELIPLRDNLAHLKAGGAITKALLTSQLPGKPAPQLYQLTLAYLKQIPLFSDPLPLVSSFQLKLLKHDGLTHLKGPCSMCANEVTHVNKGQAFCYSHAGPSSYFFTQHEWATLLKLQDARQFQPLEQLTIEQILQEKIENYFFNRLQQQI